MAIKVECSDLVRLLRLTQRKQTVNGSLHDQVTGCILRLIGGNLTTTSLVKDGVTSASHFVIPATYTDSGPATVQVPVSDIDKLLGILNLHGGKTKLSYTHEKLVIKSGKKQTTLASSMSSRAFANTPMLLNEWEDKSNLIIKKLGEKGYVLKDGTEREAFYHHEIDSNELYEALRCDNINGQKLNRYAFTLDDEGSLSVEVGEDIKGRTTTVLPNALSDYLNGPTGKPFSVTYSGGLENIVKHLDGIIKLSFIDFTPEEQSIALLIRHGDSKVFQAANLGASQ